MSPLSDLRLVSYQAADGARGGVVSGNTVHDLQAVLAPRGLDVSTTVGAMERWDEVRAALAAAMPLAGAGVGPLSSVTLPASPLYPPAMFCAGANYTDHATEMARVLCLPDDGPRQDSDKPWHYVNLPENTIIGPNPAVPHACLLPKGGLGGRDRGRHDRAMDHVAGLTVVNDLSARDFVSRETGVS